MKVGDTRLAIILAGEALKLLIILRNAKNIHSN